MPLYEYENKVSGRREIVSTAEQKDRMDYLVKTGSWRRIFGFSIAKSFTAVNPDDPRAEPVTSKTRYRDELSRLSEEHSSRFGGMEVNYQPVDIRDPKEVGVSEQGVEAAKKKARDAGKILPKIQHFT